MIRIARLCPEYWLVIRETPETVNQPKQQRYQKNYARIKN